MTDFVTPSSEELASRRRALRQQRRLRNLQNIWRVLAVAGLATGSLWVMRHPFWLIRSSEQVSVTGNTMVADESIKASLPLQYPQSLLQVKPEEIAQILGTQSPIAIAQVQRQLLPPRLKITIQERQPVAVTVPSHPANHANSDPPTSASQPGLIDSEGYWIPRTNDIQFDAEFKLPTLQVRGYNPRYQSQWPQLYATIQSSSVKISEIDWRNPNNLILHTELGLVHLGVYDSHYLPYQLATLTQLRSLATLENAPPVEYIDLSNPETPSVKVVAPPASTSEK